MVKKSLLCFLLVILCAFSIFASDFHFIFGDLSQHPEILVGFMPTYIDAGVGYKGISLIEGNTTDFQFLAGGGYSQRKLWQDPSTGELIRINPLIYDVCDFDWSLRFAQGFLDSPMGNKDLITLTLGYNGQLEIAKDSMVKGQERRNGGSHNVMGIDEFFLSHASARKNNPIYPDINGNGSFLGTQFALYLRVDAMEDNIYQNNGFLGKASFLWGPKALNSALDGYADYFAITVDAIGAYTLYEYKKNNKSWLSIVLADRANISYVTGDAIPAFIQGPTSLGRKVRGFNTYTYNTAFSAVNNLDLRFAGPKLGVNGIAPRINLFYDIGYSWGKICNTELKDDNLLSSAGAQITITFFDFIDLGYQIAYIISGDNYSKRGDKIVGSFTFFLDF